MSQINNVNRAISLTESVREHLNQLNELVTSEFGYFCENNNVEYSIDKMDSFSKTPLMPFFSSWRMDDLYNFDLGSILSILKRNNFFMSCFLFLCIFSCIYFISFILYSNCTRRIIKLFTSCCTRITKKKKEDEYDNDKSENSKNVLKIFKNILIYFFLCVLLCALIAMGSFCLHYFFKTKKDIHMNICNVSRTFENLIKDKCSNRTNDNMSCFSVENVINDTILILQKYKDIKKQIEDNSLVDVNKPIPALIKFKNSFNNLKKLKNNLSVNNNMLERRYLHVYPGLISLEKSLESIINEGNNNLKKTEGTTVQIKRKIKTTFDRIDYYIEQNFRTHFSYITNIIQSTSYIISDFNDKYSSKENINKYSNIVPFIYIILLIPPLIILIGLILYIVCILKGDYTGNHNSFYKLFGLFSAYFGFLTIITLIITTFFLTISILGGTTCVITEDLLQKRINFNFKNITIVDKCIKNENAAIIDESHVNLLIRKFNTFNINDTEEKLKEHENFFNDIKKKFYENANKIFDYMWIIIMKKDGNRYYNKIKSNEIKSPLIAIGIVKENFNFGGRDFIGIDEYLRILNQRIFPNNNNNKLCFEDNTCENDQNKYNITAKSSINDQKYIQFRDKINVLIKEDIDELVQLFILKAKIRNEKIFDVSDLDSTITEKLNWKNYTPKTTETTRNKSIIYNYITSIIESINFTEIKNFCNKIKIQYSSMTELIVQTIRSISRNSRCNKIIKEINKMKYFFCNKFIINLTTLSIFSFSFSVVSFFLWFVFLFLWLRHKLSVM
ncbi:conserved Plasmodium protein, unknown function [Plasmodium gallinaceum]|uniref:Uncharacterized protein n=1 Tax=Plasmodium gallinaceum TaxID=5849 RepID=A0A1J1GLJ5_PLAGA|nr:conserved Plasmodium protein, unknown function [Plasmodium gallinaceum]CRG93296.1 conserved Plasmodium protein, unknown function [Plasmodium gallinaceum]